MVRLAIAVVALSLAALLAAQAPPASTAQQPRFKAAVNFVRVDVYPTAGGRIVPDLRQEEFDVLEDGVRQKIETFEHVVIRAPGPETERSEPTSREASDRAASDPRNRLFVLFLDSYHTSVDVTRVRVTNGVAGNVSNLARTEQANSRIGRALVAFLDRLIGPDDLIAVTRPEMPVDSIAFTRRPSSFEDVLMRGGAWQRRSVADDLYSPDDLDATEREYVECYPPRARSDGTLSVAFQMIARRRERMVLSALRDLVHHLQNLREERKALLVVTEGWQLFRPDDSLMPPVRRGPRPVGIDRGQPTLDDPNQAATADCERDRLLLAQLDDQQEFRELLDEANRSNASFYPIDPRGLPAFDSAIPVVGRLPSTDLAVLHGRLDSLQTLAVATDGLAIVNSNEFAKNLARISDDLSSYYLLGYYSSNAKSDGKFRKIAVHVKRPGVAVRARRGYLAMTEAEAKALETAAAPPADAGMIALQWALASLDSSEVERPILLRGSYGSSPPGASPAAVRLSVVAELTAAEARQPGWAHGGDVSAVLLDPDGRQLSSGSGKISPAARTCLIQFPDAVPPGDYFARVNARWSVLTASEQVRIKVPDTDTSIGSTIVLRRGPYTGAGFQPTADPRFRRAERIRVDVPVAGTVESVAAQLLDRNGKALAVPIQTVQREESGLRIATAELALAPLAPADYVIELSVKAGPKTEKSLTAFRIVP